MFIKVSGMFLTKERKMKLDRKGRIAAASGAAAVVLFGGLALATSGFSSWNSVVQQASSLNTATITLTAGTTVQGLTAPTKNLVPGDTVDSLLDLENNGTVPFGSIEIGISDASPTALVTGTDGVTATVESCSVPWTYPTEGGTTYAYGTSEPDTCTGTVTTVVPNTTLNTLLSTPVVMTLSQSQLAKGATDYLMVATSLPSGAPQSDEGLTDTPTYTFTANQTSGITIPSGY